MNESDPEWQTAHATVTTTQAIEAYGGFQFDRAFLERMAQQLNAGNIPLFDGHDHTAPIRVRSVRAEVVPRTESDGTPYWALAAIYEIHRDDIAGFAGRSGMSVAVEQQLFERSDGASGEGERLIVTCDAAWFDDGTIRQAADCAPPGVAVLGNRLYQFSYIPDPQVFLELSLPVLQSLAYGVAGNGIYDAVRALLRGRKVPKGASEKPTILTMTVTNGSRSAKGRLVTSDESVAERALGLFAAAIEGVLESSVDDESVLGWDDETGSWRGLE